MPFPPSTYIIIGAGEFGLSTALSLLRRNNASPSLRITIIEASATLPNPSGSSVDSSRIVRADYNALPYARLALEAQTLWRENSDADWGGGGRYHEPGFLLTVDAGKEEYLRKSLENVTGLIADRSKTQELRNREEIARASGYAGSSGDWGYCNWSSGWADAEAVVAYALEKLKREGFGRVDVRTGVQVERLLFDEGRCEGVRLRDGEEIKADQMILAAGAWSGTLVDLGGRAVATGQPLAYIDISEEEQERMGGRPTIMNMSRGTFLIPPRKRELKVARHGFGYRNLKKVPVTWKTRERNMSIGVGINGHREEIEVSVPEVGIRIPKEAEMACRQALKEVVPEMADRPFARTRVCWYCDTPTGDFIVTHHPEHLNLFIATGGSGHGFKFFPVIGEKIVDILEGKQTEYAHLWRWREPVDGFAYCDDGSRAGPKGMLLHEELSK